MVLFAIYLILLAAIVSPNKIQVWPAIFDPLGLVVVGKVARYWTVVEKNTQLLSFSGIFLANRLFWLGTGLVALLVTWRFFPMSAELLTARRASGRARQATLAEEAPTAGARLPRLRPSLKESAPASSFAQLVSLTRLRFLNIVREPVFWAITLTMVVLGLVNGRFAGEANGSVVWPVTYLMLQLVQGSASLFVYIVATLYAGELVWRERDVRFDQIHDALPLRDSVDWGQPLPRAGRGGAPAGDRSRPVRRDHADRGRLLQLRAPLVRQRAVRGVLSAAPDFHSARAVHPHGGEQQVRRPRCVDWFSSSRFPFSTGWESRTAWCCMGKSLPTCTRT